MLTAGTLLIGLSLIFVIWYITFYIKRKRLYKLAAQFDGPRPLPFIGNILQVLVPLTDITDHIRDGCLYYKSPSRLWFGPYLSVHIWDPENAKIVLTNPHALGRQPYLYNLLEATCGRGLLTSPVDEWRQHRRLIAPIFNSKLLEGFYDMFSNHSNKLVENVRHKANKGTFDVHDYLVTYAIDALMDTIFDFTDRSKQSFNTQDFDHWFQGLLVGCTSRMTNILYSSDFIFYRSSVGKKFKQDKLNFDRFIAKLIQKWEENFIDNRGTSNKSIDQTESYKPMKLMDHLLSISDGRGKFTSEELHGEINNLLIAGFETTSSTVGYVLVLLGMHPKIQDKVYQEITRVLGNREHLNYADLRNLEYLERVIKESLRLFPASAALGRYTEKEIQLSDHVIPANTSIIISSLSLHRNPQIWPNPSTFDPDRFLPEEESKRHPFSWIGFSAGPRNCVDIKFGYISLKTVLSTFLLNYKVATDYSSVEDIKLTMMSVFKPTNGYRISITRR